MFLLNLQRLQPTPLRTVADPDTREEELPATRQRVLIYFEQLEQAVAIYVQSTVQVHKSMPSEHQRALEQFVSSLRCFSPGQRAHEGLCEYLGERIKVLTNGQRVDVEETNNWRLGLLQNYEYVEEQLKAARGNATFLAYSLREMLVNPDDVWEIGLEKSSSKLIVAFWQTIRAEEASLHKLMAERLSQQQRQQLSEGDTTPPLTFPLEPCMSRREARTYVPLSLLPSPQDFEELTNEARLRVALGILYLLTGIHPDDVREHQFHYELSLPNQLGTFIEQYCASIPARRDPESQVKLKSKSRINFV